MKPSTQCEERVYVRDTYRYRRGRGFSMHYNRPCGCTAYGGSDRCWQHGGPRKGQDK